MEHALWLHHLCGLFWSLQAAAYKLIGLWSTLPHLPAIWAVLFTSLWVTRSQRLRVAHPGSGILNIKVSKGPVETRLHHTMPTAEVFRFL